jgi:hypothetical protein
MPLNRLGERLSELATDRPLIVYCAGGSIARHRATQARRE